VGEGVTPLLADEHASSYQYDTPNNNRGGGGGDDEIMVVVVIVVVVKG